MTEAGRYHGFISYSHAADGLLAPRLASALQRFAKPWWKRRAVRVFRDDSSLTASPHLWSSIARAMDQSDWFILLLSPEAASSKWVNQEIDYWVSKRDPDRILPVLTDGTLTWSGNQLQGTAVPPSVEGVFRDEPRWVDMRFAKEEAQLDLKNPRFLECVADIAAALRAVPKEDLESEEVRQHRRTVRIAWSVGALVLALGLTAAVAAVRSSQNAAAAREQQVIAETNASLAQAQFLAVSAVDVVNEDPELAKLLSIQSIRTTPAGVSPPLSLLLALERALLATPQVQSIELATGLLSHGLMTLDSASEQDLVYVAWDGEKTITRLDLDGNIHWQKSLAAEDSLTGIRVGPQGDQVAVAISGASASGQGSRVEIRSAADGTILATLDLPDCTVSSSIAWSDDGSFLAAGSGLAPCRRSAHFHWVEVFADQAWNSVALVPADIWGPTPRFGENDSLTVFQPFRQAMTYEIGDPDPKETLPIVGTGQISDDGSVMFLHQTIPTDPDRVKAYDSSGTPLHQVDLPRQTSIGALHISEDGRFVVASVAEEQILGIEIRTGEQLVKLPTSSMSAIIGDIQEHRVLTGHRHGTLKIWDLSLSLAIRDGGAGFFESDDFLQLALDNLSRGFLTEECRHFGIQPCPTLNDLRGG